MHNFFWHIWKTFYLWTSRGYLVLEIPKKRFFLFMTGPNDKSMSKEYKKKIHIFLRNSQSCLTICGLQEKKWFHSVAFGHGLKESVQLVFGTRYPLYGNSLYCTVRSLTFRSFLMVRKSVVIFFKFKRAYCFHFVYMLNFGCGVFG